jgi:hypothetical protein
MAHWLKLRFLCTHSALKGHNILCQIKFQSSVEDVIYTPLSHLAHQIFQLWSNAVTNFSYFRKFHKLAFLFLIYGLSYISFSL